MARPEAADGVPSPTPRRESASPRLHAEDREGQGEGLALSRRGSEAPRVAAVPLAWRVVSGFLDREGPRFSEAAALDVADVDLEPGAVKLDENKTDDAR